MTVHPRLTLAPLLTVHQARFGDLVEAVERMPWRAQHALSDHCALTGQTRAEALADLWATAHEVLNGPAEPMGAAVEAQVEVARYPTARKAELAVLTQKTRGEG